MKMEVYGQLNKDLLSTLEYTPNVGDTVYIKKTRKYYIVLEIDKKHYKCYVNRGYTSFDIISRFLPTFPL
ncbi:MULTISPECIES: hypothetical protein [unclassified Bacillus cereus group]|uniref:hypothetical protein n=1 Tax=unclassified Bacillus cereus group TaxID=2750818 RepID=UPI001F57B405|nr:MULTISPECIES: hypothetical protein [unclassified Bacillus cereus group]